MAYSIRTKDGIVINGIPDNVPKDDPVLKGRVASLRSSGAKADSWSEGFVAPAAPAPAAQRPQEPGLIAKIGDVFTGNLRETEQTQALPEWTEMPELNDIFSKAGWKTALGTLMASPAEVVKVVQANNPGVQVTQDEKGNYLMTSPKTGKQYAIPPGFSIGDIPRAGAAIASQVGVGRLLRAAPVGAALAQGGGAARAGLSATEAGLAQAGVEASQAATGGEFSPADVLLSAATGGAIPAAASAARGAKAALTPRAATTPAQAAIREAEATGIAPLTSDIIPPKTFVGKSAQALGERIPLIGSGGARKEQAAQRIAAVRDFLDGYSAIGASSASDDVMADLVKTRGADLSKYSKMKSEVIEKVAGRGAMPVPKAVSAIDKEIQSLSKNAGTKEIDAVINDLSALKDNIQGKDIGAIEQQRAILGEKYKAPDMASVRGIAEKSLSRIYGPLREDMGDFLKNSGDRRDFTKWMVANKQLSNMAGELDNKALKSVLRSGNETPEAVQRMLFSAKPSEARALYSQLSPEGKKHAKIAILSRIAERTMSDADGSVISPERFVTAVKKESAPIGVFFDKAESQRLGTLVRALNLTRRASESGVMTRTGQEAVPYVAGVALTDIFGGGGGAMAAAASVGALSRAYESKAVRDLLAKMQATPKGSKAEADIASAISRAIVAGQNVGADRQ